MDKFIVQIVCYDLFVTEGMVYIVILYFSHIFHENIFVQPSLGCDVIMLCINYGLSVYITHVVCTYNIISVVYCMYVCIILPVLWVVTGTCRVHACMQCEN